MSVDAQEGIPKLIYSAGGFRSAAAEIRHVKYKGALSWTLHDFLTCSKLKKGEFRFESPIFELKFEKTTLKLQLQLKLNSETEDDIGLFLHNKSQEELNIDFVLMALDVSGEPFAEERLSQKIPPTGSWGIPKYFSRKGLEKDATKHLPNVALKIKVELTVYADEISSLVEEDPELNEGASLADGLAKSFRDDSLKDFDLKCGDKIFRVHKVVLASRSDAFKAMFSQESFAENKKNEATIKGCEPDTLDQLLEFIYTDRLEDEDGFNSVDLLLLADRYIIEKLRVKCEKALAKSIDRSNAVKLLSIASRITAPYLLKRAAGFIHEGGRELVKSEDWKEMVKTNPQAMDAIFQLGSE